MKVLSIAAICWALLDIAKWVIFGISPSAAGTAWWIGTSFLLSAAILLREYSLTK